MATRQKPPEGGRAAVPPAALASVKRISDLFFRYKNAQRTDRLPASGKPLFAPGAVQKWAGSGLELDGKGGFVVVLYLSERPRDSESEQLLAARSLSSVPVELRITGSPRPLGLTAGDSVGARYTDQVTGQAAGSVGALLKRTGNADLLLLSCNHILLLNGEVFVPAGDQSERVLRPARTGPPVAVTLNESFCGLKAPPKKNLGDWALAKVVDSSATPWWPTSMPALQNVPPADPLTLLNQEVSKIGATTGKTMGTITAIASGFSMPYPELGGTTFYFNGQLRVKGAGAAPFAQPGDSGSLVVTTGGVPVGLVFARDAGDTIVCPIKPLFEALNLKLAP